MERDTSEIAADSQSDASHPGDAASQEEVLPEVSPAQAAELWERFHQELRTFVASRVAGKADADDLLQAIYLRIHTTLSSPIEIVHPRGWIFQVARSVLIDHLRAAQTKDAHLSQASQAAAGSAGIPAESAPALVPIDGEDAEETLISCLQPVLETLPAPYREALVWTELHNMSQREAAMKAGISVSGMKSRVQRGRAQLKDALLACCDVQLDRRHHPIECARKSTDV